MGARGGEEGKGLVARPVSGDVDSILNEHPSRIGVRKGLGRIKMFALVNPRGAVSMCSEWKSFNVARLN